MTRDMRELATLFERHKKHVFRRSFQLLGNAADAEEATQNIFIKLIHNETQLDGSQMMAWIYRITTNHCLDRIRVNKRRRELINEKVRPAMADRDTRTPETMLTLRALLANADPKLAQCAVYIYVDGLAQAEVARLMNVSRRTVNNLLDRFRIWARAQTELIESSS